MKFKYLVKPRNLRKFEEPIKLIEAMNAISTLIRYHYQSN